MAEAAPELRKLAIVPAYNEADMVGRVVRDIHREAPGFDVLVIDDGSADTTAEQAEAAGAVGRELGSLRRVQLAIEFGLHQQDLVAASGCVLIRHHDAFRCSRVACTSRRLPGK